MPLNANQPFYCKNCGAEMMGNPNRKGSAPYGGMCTKECLDDISWKEVLYIMGKEYYPKSTEQVDEVDN